MIWFLVVSYLNTTSVDLQEFTTLEACQKAQVVALATLPPSPAVEKQNVWKDGGYANEHARMG